MAAEWAPKDIRINIVVPSLTDTPMAANLLSTQEKGKPEINDIHWAELGQQKILLMPPYFY